MRSDSALLCMGLTPSGSSNNRTNTLKVITVAWIHLMFVEHLLCVRHRTRLQGIQTWLLQLSQSNSS